MSTEPGTLYRAEEAAQPQLLHRACLSFCSLEDLDDDQEGGTTASLEVQGLVAPGMQSSSPKGALIYDRWVWGGEARPPGARAGAWQLYQRCMGWWRPGTQSRSLKGALIYDR